LGVVGVGGSVGGGRWAVGVGGCALYAPLFGPATTAPKLYAVIIQKKKPNHSTIHF